MIPAVDRWGPFADRIEPGERIARARTLRAIAHITCGPRGVELVALLRVAEADEAALSDALAALNRLASLDRRKVLTTYAVLNRPVFQTGKMEASQ
ncbi:hypothetical protein MKK67_06820 [Methylobacterium sp. J-072]|uniref:hypothetical protein n=1 Tax=Methylobacterium sp. J-072 TaxID=2836651 RepID=UPI001FBB2450|nr:hypothetical protein [Methylobacterium sp. J-072]MCJ2092209.1 hypothetical protein [Methylobacterium sp. J-072]